MTQRNQSIPHPDDAGSHIKVLDHQGLVLRGKLRIFVLDSKTFSALRGVPIRVGIGFTTEAGDAIIGTFASDHAGYLSLPLPLEIRKRKDVGKVWVEPFLDPALRKDITDLASGAEDSAMPIMVDVSYRVPTTSSSLPSTISVDSTDWKLSPNSYAAPTVTIIGENGCEEMLPSRVAERLFKFNQILRRPQVENDWMIHVDDVGREFVEVPRRLEYRRGVQIDYEMVWLPLGHGLGEVLYSLTLAPCEKVNIAVVDWSRAVTETRAESTTADERLVHDQRRDRVIEETVEAALEEWQTGESFMGGTGGTGGYGGGGMGQLWGVTGSHSIGYGTASTAGRRDAEGSTVQELADRVAQATTLSRGLRSTVVVQATQAERETLQTRVVANHNHSHALTILYYQVVRHYCVTTAPVRERDVLFIKAPPYRFDRTAILRHRQVLEHNLLDPTLAAAFPILQRSPEIAEALVEQERLRVLLTSSRITKFAVRIDISELTGDFSSGLHKDRLLFVLSTTSGQFLSWSFEHDATYEHHHQDGTRIIDQPFANPEGQTDDPPTTTTAIFDVNTATLNLDDIYELGLAFNVEGDNRHKLRVGSMQVRAVLGLGVQEVLATSSGHYFTADSEWWHKPNRLPRLDDRPEEQRALAQALIDHFVSNGAHYSAILWMNENPLERARRFSDYLLEWTAPDGLTRRGLLSDFVDNVPLGMFGDHVIFRLGEVRPLDAEDPAIPRNERILSVPTRGAFAEAKLSHCNASEIIDDSRFWDWQISPCPDEATAIAPLLAGSRAQPLSAIPTPLPAPGIGIAGIPLAPEPVGLREVMELMRTPDIFRDLSTMTELGPLLQKLVEVAGDVEKARISKLDAAYSPKNRGHNAAGVQGGMSDGMFGSEGDPQSQARQANIVRSAIDRAVQSGQITPAQGGELTQDYLRRLIGDSERSLVDNPTIQSLLGSGPSRVSVSRGDESVQLQNVSFGMHPEQHCVALRYYPDWATFRDDFLGGVGTGRTSLGDVGLRRWIVSRSNPDFPRHVVEDSRSNLRELHTNLRNLGAGEGQIVQYCYRIMREGGPDGPARYVDVDMIARIESFRPEEVDRIIITDDERSIIFAYVDAHDVIVDALRALLARPERPRPVTSEPTAALTAWLNTLEGYVNTMDVILHMVPADSTVPVTAADVIPLLIRIPPRTPGRAEFASFQEGMDAAIAVFNRLNPVKRYAVRLPRHDERPPVPTYRHDLLIRLYVMLLEEDRALYQPRSSPAIGGMPAPGLPGADERLREIRIDRERLYQLDAALRGPI